MNAILFINRQLCLATVTSAKWWKLVFSKLLMCMLLYILSIKLDGTMGIIAASLMDHMVSCGNIGYGDQLLRHSISRCEGWSQPAILI